MLENFQLILVALIVTLLIFLYVYVDWLIHRKQIPGGALDKWVLITGCDTGFGHETAKRLDSIGCRVIAGCLTFDGCDVLRRECSSRIFPIVMDVTNEESVQLTFKAISDTLGPKQGLWGLVNNAGILGTLGPVEWLTQEDFVRILDVNLLGMIRVVRTFLPLLKKSQSGGRIVNTSSILGKLSVPYAAPYCVTKHAVEAFSDALRVELHPYNIHVALIEPGGHTTKFLEGITNSTMNSWNRLSESVQRTFGQSYLKQVIFLGAKVIPFIGSSNLNGVVSAYEHALFSSVPRCRYLVGLDSFVLSISHFVPSAIIDFVLNLPGLRAVPASCRAKKQD